MDENMARQLRAALMNKIAEMVLGGQTRQANEMRGLAGADFTSFSPDELSSAVPDFDSLIREQDSKEQALNSGAMVQDLAKLLRLNR